MKLRKLLSLALVSCGLCGAAKAAPADINAQAFYLTAVELSGKGMGALFDKRTKPMMAQMQDAGARARADNIAAKAAGRPLYCVPQKGKAGVGPRELVAMLGTVPESDRRRLTLTEAWKQALARRFPCG